MRFLLSLLPIAGAVVAAQAQPAPGPVGEPLGEWREQIHWAPPQHSTSARVFHLALHR